MDLADPNAAYISSGESIKEMYLYIYKYEYLSTLHLYCKPPKQYSNLF